MPLTPNTRLSRYEILSLLDAGGMGEVYLAQDTQLRRPVAIKVLLPKLDVDVRHRDEVEAFGLANLVDVSDVSSD